MAAQTITVATNGPPALVVALSGSSLGEWKLVSIECEKVPATRTGLRPRLGDARVDLQTARGEPRIASVMICSSAFAWAGPKRATNEAGAFERWVQTEWPSVTASLASPNAEVSARVPLQKIR